MAYRLELSDLPPRYRAQAEAQLARRGKKRGDTMTAAARAAAMSGLNLTAGASMNTTSAPSRQRSDAGRS